MTAFTYTQAAKIVEQCTDEQCDALLAAIEMRAAAWDATQPKRPELAPVPQPRRWTAFTSSAWLAGWSIALTFLAKLLGFGAGWVVLLAGIDVVLVGGCVLVAILEDSRRMQYWMRGMVPPDRSRNAK